MKSRHFKSIIIITVYSYYSLGNNYRRKRAAKDSAQRLSFAIKHSFECISEVEQLRDGKARTAAFNPTQALAHGCILQELFKIPGCNQSPGMHRYGKYRVVFRI